MGNEAQLGDGVELEQEDSRTDRAVAQSYYLEVMSISASGLDCDEADLDRSGSQRLIADGQSAGLRGIP